ncbi:MAG: NUDIX hydrolase [Deltaproteobacteria bacterium]|nr:NUDIX hydrolase [Deltaproteobacteria bacterium]
MGVKKFCPYCGQRVIEKTFGRRVHGYCVKCDMIHYENPLPAVAVLVLNSKDQLLLVKRSVEPAKGTWCLPGGFIEVDESIEEAAVRELEEETGIKGEIEGLVDFFSQRSQDYRAILIFGYRVKILGGELKAGDDAQEAGFYDLDKLPPIAFLSHKRLIEKGV